jgi:hypothetical protein
MRIDQPRNEDRQQERSDKQSPSRDEVRTSQGRRLQKEGDRNGIASSQNERETLIYGIEVKKQLPTPRKKGQA